MNGQWLKSFILSADCGSFSKAAKASFISTTALVQQINLFEKELDFTVFNRSNSGLKLTAAGEDFYRTAKDILKIYELGKTRAYNIAKDEKVILRFGFEPYQFPHQWLSLLNELQLENQHIQLQMKTVTLQEQISAIRKDIIDICIIAKPSDEYLDDLKYLNLYEDTYSFCMRKDHPLSDKKILSLEDVRDYTIICGSYPYMEQSFEEGLTGASKLRHIEKEYDLTTRFEFWSGDELFVIHRRWKDVFTAFHTVIDTDISAGKVGIVYYKKFEEQAKTIKQFLLKKEYV